MPVSILILALTLAGLVFRVATSQRAASGAGRLTVRSIRQPREILMAARQFFAEGDWALTAKSTNTAVFSYELRPRGLGLFVLLLLGIIPGVLALTIGKKRLTVEVRAERDGAGSVTVVTWNSAASEPPCRDFALMVRSQEPTPSATTRSYRRRQRAGLRGQGSSVGVPPARQQFVGEHLRPLRSKPRPRLSKKRLVPEHHAPAQENTTC